MYELTYLKTDSREVNTAYYTAISDVVANIQPMHSSFCGGEIPVLMAGIGYSSPWTRDAAINTINAAAYLIPDIVKNTAFVGSGAKRRQDIYRWRILGRDNMGVGRMGAVPRRRG